MPDEPEGGRRVQPPQCAVCDGHLRPGVVWFGESLPLDQLNAAFAAAELCDVLISVGTSGLVYPAAEVPGLAWRAGATVVHVNLQAGTSHGEREYALAGLAGEKLPELIQQAFGRS